MNKLRCAIIGCGRIGCGFDDKPSNIIKTHAGAYSNNSKTELIALCDIDKKKLKKYAKKYHISKVFTDHNEMFKTQNLDCVSICTLADTHLELVRKASDYGIKGIFLEKPMSDSIENALRIVQICRKKNILLQIDHQRRFHPIYYKVKELLNKGKLGKIQIINVYYGAGIANTGSHMFDLLRFLFGDVRMVQSSFSKNESGNSLDPNLDITLEFLDSTVCRIHALSYKNYAIFQIEIVATNGLIKLDLIKNTIEYCKISKEPNVYKILGPPKAITKKLTRSPIELGLEDLVKSIRVRKEPISNGNEGLKALELIVASIKSARTKKKVILPLGSNKYKIHSK
jgi:UDP-N-acetylglucosamine 3-dehydrogenase